MTKKNFFVCVLSICLLSILSFSCAVMGAVGDVASVIGEITDNPVLASAGKATSSVAEASAPISAEQEYYIGRSVAASILGSYDVYENNVLTEYVNKVCQVLVINSGREELFKGYSVAILDSDQINAFATSGGHIFVTRGLVSCAESEDALAAVVAHEIAHVQLKHGVKAIKSDRWTDAALASAGAALNALSEGEMNEVVESFDESVNSIVSTMVNTGYSQSQEYEADALALEIMDSAGYNPAAMTKMLTQLQEKQPKSSGGFAKTHPSAEKRLSKVKKELKEYEEISIPDIRQKRFDAAMESFDSI